MKLAEMYEQRNALNVEKDALLATDYITPEQEARGLEIANKLDELNGQIKAAQLRERFATQASVQSMDKASEERSMEQRGTVKYRDQFIAYMRGQGPAPEIREVTTGTGSGILIPKVYEDGMLRYLMANTVVRNLADIRSGVQGYPTVRWNTLEPAAYDSAWTVNDQTATTAATASDPGFAEKAFNPLPCLPYTQVSRQSLVQSNFDLESEVVDTLQRQLAKNLEWAYVAGNGSTSPEGIFKVNSSCKITAGTASAGRTRAAAISGGVTVANLQKMRYDATNGLSAAYWNSPNTCWIMPQDVYSAVAQLTSGVSGSTVPIFVPSGDYQSLQNAAPMTLFGKPIYVTEFVPAFDATASTGKNVLAIFGSIQDAFAVREWGGMTMLRDEISQASSARIRFYAMAFAQSAVTRAKAMVQLQVTNAAS